MRTVHLVQWFLNVLGQEALPQVVVIADLIDTASGLHACQVSTGVVGTTFTTTMLLVQNIQCDLLFLYAR